MTYFLSDPIPALCVQALARSSALQTRARRGKVVRWVAIGMLQEEVEIQVMGGKEYSQTYLHMILSQYSSVSDCVPLLACVN